MSDDLHQRLQRMEEGQLSLEELRGLAADLGSSNDEISEKALLVLLMHTDPIVRYNAIVAAGFDVGLRSAAPQLKAIAKNDSDEDCRDASVSALGNMFQNGRDQDVLVILCSVALNDADENIRRSAYKSALIVNGVSRDEHLSLLQDRNLVVDREKIAMMANQSRQ